MAESGILVAPKFYYFKSLSEVEEFIQLHDKDEIVVLDTLHIQLQELIKCRHPERRLSQELLSEMAEQHLSGTHPASYGVWVYYPWNKHLVHVLPESEFIEVRTNRNQYKITPEEQQEIGQKKVGIIGLSVGQSVALTMAMERSFGELRLADFDTLDLSNLNRLRGSVMQLGLPKVEICAHEILELDPFLKVIVYTEGIHEQNIDSFFTLGGKLDLLIEECDGLDIKILARHKARAYEVPVLMETSDRGLLDIERFDLHPELPLLHGLIGDLDPQKLKGLSMEDKIEFLLPMVGLNALSERMKASMIEVQNSICSWPQLASSVTMGGGVAAEMSRKILLNQSTVSGRYYIDLDELVPEPIIQTTAQPMVEVTSPMSRVQVIELVQTAKLIPYKDILNEVHKAQIIEAAIAAPSGGNTQPWHLVFDGGNLLLIHELYYSQSFLDFNNLGSYLAFGAMIENISVASSHLGYHLKYRYFPNPSDPRIVAVCSFEPKSAEPNELLMKALYKRMTNRRIGNRVELEESLKRTLEALSESNKPARLHLVTDPKKMAELAEILSTAEMLLLLHPQGHHDIFNKELRFSEKEVLETRDGLDVATLNMSKAEILALKIASSRKAIEWVERIGGGEAFKKNTKKAIAASGGLGIVSMPFYSEESYCSAGEFVQKIWHAVTLAGYSFQPVTQFTYLLAREIHGNGEGYSEKYRKKMREMDSQFRGVLPETMGRELVFVFRIAKETDMEIRALRRFKEHMLISVS